MKTIYPYNKNLVKSTPIVVPDEVYVVFDQQSEIIKTLEATNEEMTAKFNEHTDKINEQTATIKELKAHIWKERIISFTTGILASAIAGFILNLLLN